MKFIPEHLKYLATHEAKVRYEGGGLSEREIDDYEKIHGKPIDEHEWCDVGVRGVEGFDGYLIISTATDSLRIHRADADAMSAHFKRKAEG